VLDASRGAVVGARVRRFADPLRAVKALQGAGFEVVMTSPRGTHLQSLAPLRGGKMALVVGNETDGVDGATVAAADLMVQIPMAGAVESLNVRVATGGYLSVHAVHAVITAHGEQAIAALWAVQERVEEELYAGFSDQDRRQLRSRLRRVHDNAIRVAGTAETIGFTW
jgi:tRNA C32,U32 (ribose-2'-O)-methylase TrmJ